MFIYKITNTVNNKVYIGQTIRPIVQRFKRRNKLNKCVSTNPDECKDVGVEIGAIPKRKTTPCLNKE